MGARDSVQAARRLLPVSGPGGALPLLLACLGTEALWACLSAPAQVAAWALAPIAFLRLGERLAGRHGGHLLQCGGMLALIGLNPAWAQAWHGAPVIAAVGLGLGTVIHVMARLRLRAGTVSAILLSYLLAGLALLHVAAAVLGLLLALLFHALPSPQRREGGTQSLSLLCLPMAVATALAAAAALGGGATGWVALPAAYPGAQVAGAFLPPLGTALWAGLPRPFGTGSLILGLILPMMVSG